MKLPEAPGALSSLLQTLGAATEKMSSFHESSRWHNWPPGDSRTMKISGADAEDAQFNIWVVREG